MTSDANTRQLRQPRRPDRHSALLHERGQYTVLIEDAGISPAMNRAAAGITRAEYTSLIRLPFRPHRGSGPRDVDESASYDDDITTPAGYDDIEKFVRLIGQNALQRPPLGEPREYFSARPASGLRASDAGPLHGHLHMPLAQAQHSPAFRDVSALWPSCLSVARLAPTSRCDAIELN